MVPCGNYASLLRFPVMGSSAAIGPMRCADRPASSAKFIENVERGGSSSYLLLFKERR